MGRDPLSHCRHPRGRARQEGRPLSREALLPPGPMSPITKHHFKTNTEQGRNMNSLTQIKTISIRSFVIAQVLVALTVLLIVPPILGEGTQHRDPGPPDVTVTGNFGRMFRNLPPFAPPSNAVRDALMELGSLGGILDANDDLAAGPVALITDPNLQLINRNNTNQPASVNIFGQFIDHDMTFDQRSRLGFPTQPIISQNARTCLFDLDSVYAGGPGGNPELYDP